MANSEERFCQCRTSQRDVTSVTSPWAVAASESNHRSVEGELPDRNANTRCDGEIKKKNSRDRGSRFFLKRPRQERAAMAKGKVEIVVERCKACGFCVEFCPTHVLALSSAYNSKGYHTPYMVHPEKCSGCDLCGMYCPDFAIYGYKEPAPAKEAAGPAAGATATAESEEAPDAR